MINKDHGFWYDIMIFLEPQITLQSRWSPSLPPPPWPKLWSPQKCAETGKTQTRKPWSLLKLGGKPWEKHGKWRCFSETQTSTS